MKSEKNMIFFLKKVAVKFISACVLFQNKHVVMMREMVEASNWMLKLYYTKKKAKEESAKGERQRCPSIAQG